MTPSVRLSPNYYNRAHSEAQPGSLCSLDGADADRLLGGSGVSREAPAPFCERPEVKLLRPTRHSLHWVMDMVFRDDECRIRTDHAPANFTTIKHMALNLTRRAPATDSLRLRRKVAAWDEDYLASLITA